jgi:hypothetical protein
LPIHTEAKLPEILGTLQQIDKKGTWMMYENSVAPLAGAI